MNVLQIRAKALGGGIASLLPGIRALTCRSSGGSCSARYCYSVWLRHLARAHAQGLPTDFACVAELGPGDSLGIGSAAVLCGVERYIALDVKQHANLGMNLRILDELIALFQARADIPDDSEFPAVQPKLADYRFPYHILSQSRLEASLAESRIAQVRAAIEGRPAGIVMTYVAPWSDPSIVMRESIDFLLSQAVLEHVDDLDTTYQAMRAWLKPTGFMSHSIDFSSHNTTRSWNGHWTLGDRTWRLVRGARPYLINRQPLSRHLALLAKHGFQVVKVEARRESVGSEFRPARQFRTLSREDLCTKGAFIQARIGDQF